jgi:hypothetical protein
MYDKDYIVTCICILIFVLALTISLTVNSVTDSNNTTKLVLNGVPPVHAYCAIHADTEKGRCFMLSITGGR